jgi:hypothetical protein
MERWNDGFGKGKIKEAPLELSLFRYSTIPAFQE